MNIVTDNTILRACNAKVKVTELKEIYKQASQMVKVMIENKGCGIAAPQVGINKRFFIAIINNNEAKLFINPEIIEKSIETNVDYEGCLSVPGRQGLVERHDKIKIKFFNGSKIVIETYTGLNARVIQHEYDHLERILYVDKVKELVDQVV